MKTRFSKKILSFLLSIVMVITAVPAFAITAQADTADKYLFAYFCGDDTKENTNSAVNQKIRFATSDDGINYTPINGNQPILSNIEDGNGIAFNNGWGKYVHTPGARDPFIINKRDSSGNIIPGYYVVATDLRVSEISHSYNNTKMLVYNVDDITKADEVHPWVIETAGMFNDNGLKTNADSIAWAPEVTWDYSRNQYAMFWSGPYWSNSRINVVYTDDFRTFNNSNGQTINGTTVTPETLFSVSGGSCIDANINYEDGNYYLIYKREDTSSGEKGKLYYVVASSLQDLKNQSPVRFYDSEHDGDPDGLEGPEIFKAGNKWILMADEYINPVCSFAMYDLGTSLATGLARGASYDHKADRGKITTNINDVNPRHGGIAYITSAEKTALEEKFSLTTNNSEIVARYFTTSDKTADASGNNYSLTQSGNAAVASVAGVNNAVRFTADGTNTNYFKVDLGTIRNKYDFNAQDGFKIKFKLYDEKGDTNGYTSLISILPDSTPGTLTEDSSTTNGVRNNAHYAKRYLNLLSNGCIGLGSGLSGSGETKYALSDYSSYTGKWVDYELIIRNTGCVVKRNGVAVTSAFSPDVVADLSGDGKDWYDKVTEGTLYIGASAFSDKNFKGYISDFEIYAPAKTVQNAANLEELKTDVANKTTNVNNSAYGSFSGDNGYTNYEDHYKGLYYCENVTDYSATGGQLLGSTWTGSNTTYANLYFPTSVAIYTGSNDITAPIMISASTARSGTWNCKFRAHAGVLGTDGLSFVNTEWNGKDEKEGPRDNCYTNDNQTTNLPSLNFMSTINKTDYKLATTAKTGPTNSDIDPGYGRKAEIWANKIRVTPTFTSTTQVQTISYNPAVTFYVASSKENFQSGKKIELNSTDSITVINYVPYVNKINEIKSFVPTLESSDYSESSMNDFVAACSALIGIELSDYSMTVNNAKSQAEAFAQDVNNAIAAYETAKENLEHKYVFTDVSGTIVRKIYAKTASIANAQPKPANTSSIYAKKNDTTHSKISYSWPAEATAYEYAEESSSSDEACTCKFADDKYTCKYCAHETDVDMSNYNQLKTVYSLIDLNAYDDIEALVEQKAEFDGFIDEEIQTVNGKTPQSYVDAEVSALLTAINDADVENKTKTYKVDFYVDVDGVSTKVSTQDVPYGVIVSLDASAQAGDTTCYTWTVATLGQTRTFSDPTNVRKILVQSDAVVTAYCSKSEKVAKIYNPYNEVLYTVPITSGTVITKKNANTVTIGGKDYTVGGMPYRAVNGFTVGGAELDTITVTTQTDIKILPVVVASASAKYAITLDGAVVVQEAEYDDEITVTSAGAYAIAIDLGAGNYSIAAYGDSYTFYANRSMNFYTVTKNGGNYTIDGNVVSDKLLVHELNDKLPVVYSGHAQTDAVARVTAFNAFTAGFDTDKVTILEAGTLYTKANGLTEDTFVIGAADVNQLVCKNYVQPGNQYSLSIKEGAGKGIKTRAYIKYAYNYQGKKVEAVTYGNICELL